MDFQTEDLLYAYLRAKRYAKLESSPKILFQRLVAAAKANGVIVDELEDAAIEYLVYADPICWQNGEAAARVINQLGLVDDLTAAPA